MAKTGWYAKKTAAEKMQTERLARLYIGMTGRELVAELRCIEDDDREMRHAPNVNGAAWERLSTRDRMVRAEIARRHTNGADGAHE